MSAVNATERRAGEIITFYSYKGGTGRTMALANTACLLAERNAKQGKVAKILVVDWDFEAPGLHRYFLPYLGRHQRGFDRKPGCLDFFEAINRRKHLSLFKPGDVVGNRKLTKELIAQIDLSKYLVDTTIDGLHVMKAGKFDEHYGRRVGQFDWVKLFEKTPGMFSGLADYWRENFDYVLVDSRTGVTDTSGICTCLLPDKLVTVFTPNGQSLTGLEEVIKRAIDYRCQSADWRPLVVFPLPSRIEMARPTLFEAWRHGIGKKDTKTVGPTGLGYQPLFENIFSDAYGLDQCNLSPYFNEVLIQHIPDYAYGEPIAVREEKDDSRIFLRTAYTSFVDRLAELPGPWVALERARADVKFLAMCDDAELAIDEDLPSNATRLATAILREGRDCSRDVIERVFEIVIKVARTVGNTNRSQAIELLDDLAKYGKELLPNEPDELAGKLETIAQGLQYLGQYREARHWVEEAIATVSISVSKYNEQRARLTSLLIQLLHAEGRYVEATSLAEKQVASLRQLKGNEHPDTLTAMSYLAGILYAQGKLDAAQTLQESVLAAQRRLLGDEHHDTLTAMNNLADTLRARGDLPAAHALQESVLAAHCRQQGEDHPDKLTTMNNMAITLLAQGNLSAARALQESVLAGIRRQMGDEHPNTLSAMNNLAETLRAQGDLAAARTLQESVLEAWRRLLGDEHPNTLTFMINLASTLHAQGDLAGARTLQESSLAARRRLFGDAHPDTLTAMNNLAETLRDQGDLVAARTLQEAVLEARRRLLGEEHPNTLTSMGNLATTLWALGDLPAARALEESVLVAFRRLLGKEHPNTLTAMNNLAETLRAQGDLAAARKLQESTLAARLHLLGEEHPDTLSSMDNLAITLRAQGDLAAARTLQETVLSARRHLLGAEHPSTLSSLNNLARIYYEQGELSEARPLMEQSLEGWQHLFGDQHPATKDSAVRLALVLGELGEKDAAHKLMDKFSSTSTSKK